MRVIIPPLTSQYLNLTKNSSLAVAIGYPDLVQVFAGTVLNQTGQAVEVVAITMAVYLTISLVTSVADEHLQPPHGAGGAVSAIDHDRRRSSRCRSSAFVRTAPLAPLPPPPPMTGAIGWVRENLFSTPFNIALTIVVALLLALDRARRS